MNSAPLYVIVPFVEPVMLWISSSPVLIVVVAFVQLVHEFSRTLSFTVSDALPALVISPLSFAPEHVFSVSPDVPFQVAEVPFFRVNSRFVPAVYLELQGFVLVLQRTVAEAEPAPTNAIKAVATTARRSILTYFISHSSLSAHLAPGFDL